MIYGVTGPSRLLTPEQIRYVHRTIKRNVLRNRKRNKLVSGMAFGVDTEAVLAVWGLIPFENLICVVPGSAPHNYGLVDQAKRAGAEIVIVPNEHTVGATYLARDTVVAQRCRTLLAFPSTPKEESRSGTWATIRRARKADRKIRLYALSGAT